MRKFVLFLQIVIRRISITLCEGDESNDIESDADGNQDEKEHELESYSI